MHNSDIYLPLRWNSNASRTIEPFDSVLLLQPLIVKGRRHHHFLSDWTGSEYPSSLLLPPMEFLHIYAVLEREGKKVDFLDASARHWSAKRTIDYALAADRQLLVMSVTFNSLHEVMNLAERIHQAAPQIHIALFGPPLTLRPDLALASSAIEYVIMGEPEKPVTDLMNGRLLTNIAYREGEVIHCLPRHWLEPLDWLPFPARQLLDPNDYVAPYSKDFPFTVITSSRGCSHNICKFCTQRVWSGEGIRYHSVEYVIAEIDEAIQRFGYREIFFRDQVFTSNREFTLSLCDRIRRKNFRFPWRATTRISNIDEELLAAMKGAGCYQLSYGLESSSQDVLNMCQKGITIEDMFRTIKLTKAKGIETVGNFIIGLKGDSPGNLQSISDFAHTLGCDYAQFLLIQIWPDFSPEEIGTEIDREELIRLTSRAYRRFYLNPKFIWGMLKRINSWRIFIAVVRSAYRLLTEKQVY